MLSTLTALENYDSLVLVNLVWFIISFNSLSNKNLFRLWPRPGVAPPAPRRPQHHSEGKPGLPPDSKCSRNEGLSKTRLRSTINQQRHIRVLGVLNL